MWGKHGWKTETVKGLGGPLMWNNIVSLAYQHRINLSSQTLYNTPGLLNAKDQQFYGYTYSACCSTVEIDVEDYRFDADNNNNTQIDTVTIAAGDTVQWNWVEGTHTVTDGLSSAPEDNPGMLFDAPVDSDNQTFSFEFTEPGTYPYFCREHELLEMKGIIEVQ